MQVSCRAGVSIVRGILLLLCLKLATIFPIINHPRDCAESRTSSHVSQAGPWNNSPDVLLLSGFIDPAGFSAIGELMVRGSKIYSAYNRKSVFGSLMLLASVYTHILFDAARSMYHYGKKRVLPRPQIYLYVQIELVVTYVTHISLRRRCSWYSDWWISRSCVRDNWKRNHFTTVNNFFSLPHRYHWRNKVCWSLENVLDDPASFYL